MEYSTPKSTNYYLVQLKYGQSKLLTSRETEKRSHCCR